MIVEKGCHLDLDGTTTRTVVLFKTTRAGKLIAANWHQELAVDGVKTVKLHNVTKAVDMTAALTINGLGALAAAALVLSTTLANRDYKKGDVIQLIYTVTTAGTVAPGECGVELLCRHAFTGEVGDED